VNFEELRIKYAPGGPGNPNPPPNAAKELTPEETEAAQQLSEKLDSIRACGTCMGSGMERYTYNMQQRERTCETCDGDGLIDLRPASERSNSAVSAAAAASGVGDESQDSVTPGDAAQEHSELPDEPPPVLF